jgi:hypothetical protein
VRRTAPGPARTLRAAPARKPRGARSRPEPPKGARPGTDVLNEKLNSSALHTGLLKMRPRDASMPSKKEKYKYAKHAAPRPGDERFGAYTQAELAKMDQRFVERMEWACRPSRPAPCHALFCCRRERAPKPWEPSFDARISSASRIAGGTPQDSSHVLPQFFCALLGSQPRVLCNGALTRTPSNARRPARA